MKYFFLLTGLTLSLNSWSQGLTIDKSFGEAGKVIMDFGGQDTGQSIAIQSDGKILVAAESGGQLNLIRLTTKGKPDKSFNGSGNVTSPLSWIKSMAVQPDGKIIVAGSYKDNFAMIRVMPDGSIDKSFIDLNSPTRRISDNIARINAIARQPDGKILAAGFSILKNSDWQAVLVRYNSDGSIDTGFGKEGIVTRPATKNTESFNGVNVDNGAIFVVGSIYSSESSYDFYLAKLAMDGTIQQQASSNLLDGSRSIDEGLNVYIRPDGSVAVAGDSNDRFSLVMYDQSFKVLMNTRILVNEDKSKATCSAQLIDGRFIIGGDSNQDWGVALFKPNGAEEIAFGDNATHTFVEKEEQNLKAIAVQSDGKLVLLGTQYGTNGIDISLKRITIK